MLTRSLGHRAPLLWLAGPLLAGLIAGRFGPPVPAPWLLAAAAGGVVLAALAMSRQPRLALAGIVIAGIAAGSARYTQERARLWAWEELPPREARLEVELLRVFPPLEPGRCSALARIDHAAPHLRELIGQRIYLGLQLAPGEPLPVRSAVIAARGVLTPVPVHAAANTFDGFLAAAGVNFRLSRGRVLGPVQAPTTFRIVCVRAAEHFASLLDTGIASKRPEFAAVLRAMLLGQKHELNDEQDTLFMRSGTMHLFAISGLHIGIIAVGLHALLALLRLPAGLRFALGTVALWLYVEITGGAPSAVRAFIMVATVEAAQVLRAPGNPLAALTASALLVTVVWPMQVFSASFQLSYGIVAALLLFGLPLADAACARWPLFERLPKPAWRWYHRWLDEGRRKVVAALAIGVASSLVSTLAGVHYFQLFTPIALPANLALIPAASLVILAGFASLVAGLLGLTALGGLFNHAAALVLALIDAVVRTVVDTPGAWCPAHFAAGWIGPAAFFALGVTLVVGYAQRWSARLGGWWPPVIVVALTLLAGVRYG